MQRIPLLSYHEVRDRYLQESEGQLRDKGVFEEVTPVYQGYGAHFIDLWVGTPPQRQTVIVDTGSSTTGIPCNQCHDCGQGMHMHKNFNETLSETFRNLGCNECSKGACKYNGQTCEIGMRYEEGSSWHAIEASDIIRFGGFHSSASSLVNMEKKKLGDVTIKHESSNGVYQNSKPDDNRFRINFGCQSDITGLFKTQLADGILGMSNTDTALWNQMYEQKVIPSRRFSLCYIKNVQHFNGVSAGSLTFGGTDERLHIAPMVYTKTDPLSKFYAVNIRKIYIHPGGGELLTGPNADIHPSKGTSIEVMASEDVMNKGGTVVDSGTTSVCKCLFILILILIQIQF